MREIKFRGKRIDNGEWVVGFILKNKLATYIVTEENPHECTMNGYIEIDEYHRADPKTVGQYTGRTAQLTDKIYEGDICEVTTFDHNDNDTQRECIVKYIDGSFGFSYEGIFGEVVIWLNDVYDTDSHVKIIGNIHD